MVILTRERYAPSIRIYTAKDAAAVYSAPNAAVIVKRATATTAAHAAKTRTSMQNQLMAVVRAFR